MDAEPRAEPSGGELSLVSRAGVLLVALGAGAMFAWVSWDKPFYTKGEPREAIEVQAIASGRTVLVPLRNGEEIPSKPPMFHWLGAVASLAFGQVTEFSSRLPSVAAGAGTVALTAGLGVRLFGVWTGLSAGMLLATAGIFFVGATGARVDMTLAFFITLALYSFFTRYAAGRRPSHLMYVACALAVLTKGPVGLALPGAVAFSYLLVRRDFAYMAGCLAHRGLVWMLLPVTWYALAWMREGQAFADKLFFKENLYRVLDPDSVEAGHVKPWYAYFPLLLGGFAPWSLLLPAAAVFAWRARREDELRGALFVVLWFVVPFLLFSAAGSKRSIYLLPAYPALALLVARWWSLLGGELDARELSGEALVVWSSRLLAAVVILAALLVFGEACGLGIFTAVGDRVRMSEGDRANLAAIAGTLAGSRAVFAAWAAAAAVLAVTFSRSLARGRARISLVAAVALMASSVVVLSTTLQHEVAKSQSVGPMVSAVAAQAGRERPMVFFDGYDYAAVFYAQRPIRTVTSFDGIDDPAGTIVFVREGELQGLLEEAREAGGFEGSELARHDYAGNPRRAPLLALRFERPPAPEHASAPGALELPDTPSVPAPGPGEPAAEESEDASGTGQPGRSEGR